MSNEANILELIGRKSNLFGHDIKQLSANLDKTVASGRFLVIGGAGSIGQAVTKEIFKRNPSKIHVVDIRWGW